MPRVNANEVLWLQTPRHVTGSGDACGTARLGGTILMHLLLSPLFVGGGNGLGFGIHQVGLRAPVIFS